MRKQTGIRVRHGLRCRTLQGGNCNCAKTYEAAVYSARDGKKIRKSFPTEAAARLWRTDAQSAVNRGGMRAPTATTVREAVEEFYGGARDGSIRNRQGLVYKPSVIRRWEGALNTRRDASGLPVARRRRGEAERHGSSLLDELGAHRLAGVERNDLQRLVERMLGWGLDPSTIRNTINALRPIFRRALDKGDLLVNPTVGLAIPAPRGKRLRIADPQEAEQLIAALAKPDQALLATACYAGLRLGELQALRWSCVDLASGVIRVEWSYDPKEHTFIDVKTSASYRKVPLAAVLRDYLLEHKLSAGRSEGLVFGRTAELPFIGTNVHRRACTAWRRAGLDPLGFHEARHTFASLMIAADVNVKAISSYMGHASVKITLDRYGHLFANSEAEAAGRLDAYLARASLAPVSRQSATLSGGSQRITAETGSRRTCPNPT